MRDETRIGDEQLAVGARPGGCVEDGDGATEAQDDVAETMFEVGFGIFVNVAERMVLNRGSVMPCNVEELVIA